MKVHPEMLLKTKDGKKGGAGCEVQGLRVLISTRKPRQADWGRCAAKKLRSNPECA